MDFITKAQLFAQDHFIVIAIVLFALLAVCAFFIARQNSRAARKHDTLCAKPLSLSPDEDKAVKVRYARKPKRVIFLLPAALTTDEDVNAWADAVAPRLGHAFQAVNVETIPQGLFSRAKYRVTFARLEELR